MTEQDPQQPPLGYTHTGMHAHTHIPTQFTHVSTHTHHIHMDPHTPTNTILVKLKRYTKYPRKKKERNVKCVVPMENNITRRCNIETGS